MGDLVIDRETTLCEIPRGRDGKEVLRVQLVEARTERGQVTWHSLRVFWQDEGGNWKPGRQGITIRARELDEVIEALRRGDPAPAQASREQERRDDEIPF